MSFAEISWRVKSQARDLFDNFRYNFRWYPSEADVTQRFSLIDEPGFHAFAGRNDDTRVAEFEEWKQALILRAERIAAHTFSFFNMQDAFLGAQIDWNWDFAHGRAAPMGYSQSIDYRDFRVTGDCKLVWEPNRHHHLVVLGRAYRVTGDRRYAAEALAQIESWMDQCPFGSGMNWRSPLELGIRLINWVWTIDLIRESGLIHAEMRARLLHNIYFHLLEITRRYSKGSSANNHLIGEAAGVFVASAYFNRMQNAQKWLKESQIILEREIIAQTHDDGCTREHAMGYHLFVLQFFLTAGLVGRWTGRDFSTGFWRRIECMLAFGVALSEGCGQLPLFGDADEGYVLDLGQGAPDIKDLLCVGAILFNRSDFKKRAGGFREPALWLLGSGARRRFNALPSNYGRSQLASKGFKGSGYYLLQCGAAESPERISVWVDCAELGYGAIAAHGHADALSFVLCAFGREVFVDPGTYDYFTYPEWRAYFRSTRAHNTVVIDNQDQSVMLGPFMWGHRANSRIIEWNPRMKGGGCLAAEHDGYRRLKDPVIHRRSFKLDPTTRRLAIVDEIGAGANHHIAHHFHMSERCNATILSADTVCISLPEGEITLTVDQRLKLTLFKASEEPKCGWVSKGYHRKVSAPTVVAEGLCLGSDTFSSIISVGLPKA